MKKIYMTFLLLMIAIVSFAEDEVVKNGVRYTLLGKEARATLINKELTDIVVDPEVSIEGQVYPVTYVYTNSYSDVFLNTKTISIPSNSSVGFPTSADVFPALEEWKTSGTAVGSVSFVQDKCLYTQNYGEWSISVPAQLKGKLNISDKLTYLNLGPQQYPGVTSLHLSKSVNEIELWYSTSQFPSLLSISVDAENTSFSTDPEGVMLIKNSEVQFFCAGVSSINVPEGVTSCTLYYGSYPNLKQITLPSTVTNFSVQDAPNLEKFVMPVANSNYKVVDGVLFDLNNNNFILPKKAKVLDLAAAGCQMTDINLTDYPYLQKLVTNDNVQSISLVNLPGLQTLVMGKNVNSFGFRDTYNIADFEISSGNETFVKDANGVVMERDNSWGTERQNLCYIPATVSSYCIPKDEDISEVTYAKWPNLKTLTMEEREQTDNYQRYFIKNNILYKSYYGNGAIAIDAPGGITDLTFCKEMDQVYDVYGESWLNLLSKVQNISVEEGNTTFSVVGDYLCQKKYMYGYTGENEWDPYQLKLVMTKPFTGTTLSLFTTLPEGFSTDYPFMGFAIGSYLYDKNSHIQELIIGENVIESDQCCFNECKNLEKVTFLGYQFTLGHMSFYGCSKLSDITFPEQLIMPNASAFYNTAWWRTQEGDMRYAGNTLYYVSNQVTDIDIPQGTYCVSQNALSNASEAKSITIPASVAYWYDESSMQKVEQLTINADYFDNLVNQAFVNYSGLKRVISSRPSPVYFEEEKINKIFPYDLSQVELIVPDDHYEIDEKTGEKYWVTPKADYSKANEWSRFGKIVDNTTSGIGSVTADKPSLAETRFAVRGNEVDVLTKGAWSIFSMAGQLVKSGCGNGSTVLPSGMYVIKGAGKAAKFIVK
ncbi:leucine-rich repeat protein [Segatella hominis]|uniref:leucine-rich repeat protein n=1 Tax=Segatella hominis TaxID=2518605 RepID=UPI003F7F44F8